MTINELIAQLQQDADSYGGETEVVVLRYTGGDEEPINVTSTEISGEGDWKTLVII